MSDERSGLILVNAVGLTPRLLASAPRLSEWASKGWMRPLREVLPAVTSTAQATILTGKTPQDHGAVANGWLFRETQEVRFWQQSNSLLQSEPITTTVHRHRGPKPLTCAKLFWWFNQGAEVDWSITPKPYYGCDGNKIFDVASTPVPLAEQVKSDLGPFPFHTFWGPGAGKGCTEWIAKSAAWMLDHHRPDLTLVYLPYLDYDPQRYGPSHCDMAAQVKHLDDACEPLFDAARRLGARVWFVSEYGHCDVTTPIFLNRTLRKAGLLKCRDGPFGEVLETFQSRAFAVCDHQIAHIYVRYAEDVDRVYDLIRSVDGVADLYRGEERRAVHLDHPRSGELIAFSRPDAWFAYPYWLDDARAPDFARTVDIHRKPGFDPCEMFFDPKLVWPMGRVLRRLVAKKLGFRMKMDVVPLDATIVRGSHGLAAPDPLDRPILIGDGEQPGENLSLLDVHGLVREALGIDGV